MKKVFSSNNECIHVFAQRTQDEGRNSSRSTFFYDDTIYSYGHHYELGRFLSDDTILINDEGYSVSTSKHISILMSATSQYKRFYKTKTDINLVHNQIIEAKNKLAKARKPEIYISMILTLWESMNEFAEFDRKLNKIAKSKYSLFKSDKYREIKRLVNALNKDSEGLKARLNEHAKKEAAKKKRDDARKLKIELARFNDYEISWFRAGDEDFVRLSKCGGFVETSQGVKVQRSNAKILYKMIQAGRDIAGHRIEHYRVTSINGTLKIGCHNINIDSMHKVGKLL